MKATLSFNLTEEKEAFMHAMRGARYVGFMYEFEQYLRTLTKHGHEFKDASEAVNAIYDQYYKLRGEEFDDWNEL